MDYRQKGHKWVTGAISAKTDPVSYEIQVDGTVWRRHIDQSP